MSSPETLPVTVTCAPCCWGVDDVKNPHLPPLDEAAAAGFGALELGPYGYMPLDVGHVGAALDARGLSIVAGTIFDDLVSRRTEKTSCARPTKSARSSRHCRGRAATTARLPSPLPHRHGLWGHDERDYAAGHSDRAPCLDADAWAGMVSNMRAIADLARDRYGVRAVIHPRAGGYIEFEDEPDRIAADLPTDLAGLCLDTGHLDYSGMDPVATIRRYADRIDYIHFKDIDPSVYADVMGGRIRFFEACGEGVMCSIGRSRIDDSY